jgi:hypothetical protein
MPFNKFISIVLGILGSYYFIIILFDVLKSGAPAVQATDHIIRFENKEKPVIIVDEPVKQEDRERRIDLAIKSPVIDLGLETISGEAYTVNAENLSKFIMS